MSEIIPVEEPTEVGSYFVANYPPFSVWTDENVERFALPAFGEPPRAGVGLGMYLHIPFCRKRCHFCYFRVYTDKNSEEVNAYLDVLVRELELYADLPAITGRPLDFIYFGGGTPSFLSSSQLDSLVSRLVRIRPWSDAREITFECEPGTLTETKLASIRDMGITRLSLGVENFDDTVLEVNGRAHLSKEIFRAYGWARDVGFDQINIDLIAGMVGETDSNWQACVRKTIELAPESVTIYQMELPYNTVFSRETNGGSGAVADWPTKRAWVAFAFDALEQAGYRVSSGYTMVKDASDTRFEYRDSLWRGADMLGVGVASFSHLGGMHVQNLDAWEDYVTALSSGTLPLARALKPTPHQRLIREFILQLKFGRTDVAPLGEKFGVDVLETFSEPLRHWRDEGMLTVDRTVITLTRAGLLRVDGLLPAFFEPQHQGIRYT